MTLARIPRPAALVVLLLLASSVACRAPASAPPAPADELRPIEHTLDVLYRSFCFDAGGEADWESMRSVLVEGAAFVAPVRDGVAPRAVGSDRFVQDFRDWIATSHEGRTGFHERIEHLRIDVFGNVAHAWVLFEGFVPGEEQARTRGIDSIQLVRAGERWLVASFTTQFEGQDQPVPARFEAPRAP